VLSALMGDDDLAPEPADRSDRAAQPVAAKSTLPADRPACCHTPAVNPTNSASMFFP